MTTKRPQSAMPRDESPGAVRMRRLRGTRRAANLCPECGDSPATGKKQCKTHQDMDRDRKRLSARRSARLKQQPY